MDNWGPSAQTDQETQVRCPGTLRRGRAEMWGWEEKEVEAVREVGKKEERGKTEELSNSLPQVPLGCGVWGWYM